VAALLVDVDPTVVVGAVAAITGAAVGALLNQRGARQTAQLTLQTQLDLDSLKDAQSLRNARREGLVKTYEITLEALVGMQYFTALARQPQGAAEAEILEVVKLANLARARLVLEVEAASVSTEFERLFVALTAFRQALSTRQDGSLEEQQFAEVAAALTRAIHASLAPLNQPIRDLNLTGTPTKPRPWWAFWR
jgi:hypothetical protein